MHDPRGNPPSDHEPDLAAAVRRGDRAAFEAMFREHYEGMVRFANRFVRSPADAEEIVQDVFLNVWTKRDKLVIGEELKTYLFRATRNRALNHLRRGRVEQLWQRRQPAEEPAVEQEEVGDLDATEAAVRSAIAALPPRCREIFLMSRQDGLSYAAIASMLDISIKTVETQMGRALKALRAALEHLRDA